MSLMRVFLPPPTDSSSGQVTRHRNKLHDAAMDHWTSIYPKWILHLAPYLVEMPNSEGSLDRLEGAVIAAATNSQTRGGRR